MKKLFLPTLFFVLISGALTGQSVSEKRSFMKSLPASKGTKLEVKNKYGNIHLTSWNKDSVYVMAEIEAFAPNRSKLLKMFDGIEVDISGSGTFVRAETIFNHELNDLLESFKGLTKKIINYDSRLEVNYFINVPDYIDISIDNKFGDVSVENNKGSLSAAVSNGDFKANSLERVSELSLDFGDATILSVKSCNLKTTFSKFEITAANELSINSTSSKFDLGEIGKAEVESRRDKFYIKNLSELKGVSYFTDFKIENLSDKSDLTLKYGSLTADRISGNFSAINLNSSYSDVTLNIVQDASYEFKIRHINAFVVLPDKNTKSEKEVLNEDRKEYLITGKAGNGNSPGKISIEATRGNIYLK